MAVIVDAYRRCLRFSVIALIGIVLAACSGAPETPDITPDVDWDVIAMLSETDREVSWRDDVQPVLEQRCIVCHGCYDAPCQLKLSSYDGLIRGANPAKVYDGGRIRAVAPTRLGIDATTPEEWQEKGFHLVLDKVPENLDEDPAERLRNSVFYRMMRMKQLNPQPRVGLVPESVTLKLSRKQVCTNQQDFAKFERENPLWGMPYGMPNLADKEYRMIVAWLAQGAQAPEPAKSSAGVVPQIERWELFLNDDSDKQRLVSRYLYEHLFLGHMHFDGSPDREFYRLVRSFTAPGEPIHEIPTTRPFDDPGVEKFYYRLSLLDESIVAKAHIVYPLSDARLKHYQELFIEPEYTVEELPGYVMPDTANPFKTFAALPVASRYQFMLDDSRYFIMGFIKGPVCRGQVALSVIEDQFWVMFSDPDSLRKDAQGVQKLLDENAGYMRMPASTQSFNIFAAYGSYWKSQKEYLAKRNDWFAKQYKKEGAKAFSGVWDGDGKNPNAALTVFRNFDSAAVEYGLLGDYPETAWIIDYPLFERIHYLLVAGFDVYGNIGHQANSRLFMDFLRMEGEDNFLTYLPLSKRKEIRDQWYQGIREKRGKYFQEPMIWSEIESPLEFKTDDPQRELYKMVEGHLGEMAGPVDYLNRCNAADCVSPSLTEKGRRADTLMKRLHKVDKTRLRDLQRIDVEPDVVYLRVLMDDEPDLHYTILRNKSYKNLNSLLSLGDPQARDPVNDTYSVLRAVTGAYPNFFMVVPYAQLEDTVEELKTVDTMEEYQTLVAKYGVRRTSPYFWEQADWFQQKYAEEQPIEAGILDLNRYGNF